MVSMYIILYKNKCIFINIYIYKPACRVPTLCAFLKKKTTQICDFQLKINPANIYCPLFMTSKMKHLQCT